MEIKKLELFKIEMSMAIQILLKHTEHINESKMRLDFLTEQISCRQISFAGRSGLYIGGNVPETGIPKVKYFLNMHKA